MATKVFLWAIIILFVVSGCSVAPPPQEENPTIEKSAPEKPKPVVKMEKELKEEFKKPIEAPPER